MNFKTVIQSLDAKKFSESWQSTNKANSKPVKYTIRSNFELKLYFLLLSLIVGLVGGINWLVDPLWYGKGNRITGQNFAFNERVAKTNLFLKTRDEVNYNCLILGSSRVIALRASEFSDQKCFNYAVKGGQIPEFEEYSQFLQESNFQPETVYIGVDGLNFVQQKRAERAEFDITKVATTSFIDAYFSIDVLSLSLMTLLGISSDPGNYYNSNFEVSDFDDAPVYKPALFEPAPPQECDLSIVERFAKLREFFPEAKFVGYVPPRSPWTIVNETYGRELMDCYITAFHQVAQHYDAFYDFSIPSEVTKDPENTFDGGHYFIPVNNKIAQILQGKEENFGVKVDDYSYEEYRSIYMGRIKEFLASTPNATDYYQLEVDKVEDYSVDRDDV